MAFFLGKDGGISIGLEAVAYNTAATTFVHQHPVSSSLQPRKEILLPNVLRPSLPAVREYDAQIPQGDLVIAYNKSRAVIAPALAILGALATDTYTMGGTSDPDTKSASARVNHGGEMLQYTGLVPQRARFAFAANTNATLTLTLVGAGVTHPTVVAPTSPVESGIYMPSDLSGVTIGGVACSVLSATIDVILPYTGADRRGLSAGAILEPQLTSFISVEASLNVELADDTGYDTLAIIDSWLAGTALGTIALASDFSLANCYMLGDGPNLQDGIQPFTIRVQPSALTVVTTA